MGARPAHEPADATEARRLGHVEHRVEVAVERAVGSERAAVGVVARVVDAPVGGPAPHLQLGAVGPDGGQLPRNPPQQVVVLGTAVELQVAHRAQAVLPVEAVAVGLAVEAIEREPLIAPPAREDDLSSGRIDGRPVGAVALGGDPVQPPAVGVDDVKVARARAAVVRERRPSRRGEHDAAIGQPRRVVVVDRPQRFGHIGARRVVEGELMQAQAVEADDVEAPGPGIPGRAAVVGAGRQAREHDLRAVVGDVGAAHVDEAERTIGGLPPVDQDPDPAGGIAEQQRARTGDLQPRERPDAGEAARGR